MSGDDKHRDPGMEENDEDFVDGQVEIVETPVDYEGDNEDELADELVEVDIEDLEELMADDENEEFHDDSVLTINKHEGAVFCVDSFNDYIVSGGEDDKAFLWKLKEKHNEQPDLKIETEKFKDSVVSVKFSCDGKYIACADMSGNIRVYLVETNELFWSHDIETDVETISWHPNCNVLFCSTSDGYFYMFKLSTGEIKLMYGGDNTSLSCFRILKDGKRSVCCYNNGTVRIWDLKTAQSVNVFPNAHEAEILSLDVSPDGNLVASAGTDMKIHLINTTNGKFICDLKCESFKQKEKDEEAENEDGEQNSIESLAFCKTLPLLACATVNGEIFIWDLNTQSVRNKVENKFGFSKILWNNSELLYTAGLDGSIQVYDGRNLNQIKKYSCHQAEILDFCFNKNLTLFFTTSEDKTIKVFEINQTQ